MENKEYKLQSIRDFLDKNGLLELSNNTIETIYNDINNIEFSIYKDDVVLYGERDNLNLTENEITRMCKDLDNNYDSNLSLWDNIEIAFDNL